MTERDDASPCTDSEPGLDEVATGAGTPDEEAIGPIPWRVGCRTDLRGWAGAHLHGAVRPRRRAAGRGRPPGRWC